MRNCAEVLCNIISVNPCNNLCDRYYYYTCVIDEEIKYQFTQDPTPVILNLLF